MVEKIVGRYLADQLASLRMGLFRNQKLVA